MAKRKREEAEISDQMDSVKRQRVQHKLKIGETKIGHAFKVSKGFERQKLGKRQKKATIASDEKVIQRIDSEITALKALDTTASARQHLFKSLLKIQDVSNHPDLPPKVKQLPDLPTDSATLNVQSRLCKANQVTEALNATVVDIKKALGLNADLSKLPRKRRLRAKDYAAGNVVLPSASVNEVRVRSPRKEESDNHHYGHNGTEEHLDSDSDSESIIDNGDADDDVEALERRLASEGFRSKTDQYDIEADLSLSGSESDRRSPSPEIRKAAPSGRSSFLPSLSLSGYVEGSGSDIEEETGCPPKKNRRGQRARQQIWEMKHGSRANHLQDPNRNAKWDPKRGAVGGGGGRKGREFPEGLRNDGMRQVNVTGGRLQSETQRGTKSTANENSGPIHPSWEAAKRAKQKDAPAAFQGKKTTFE